MPIYNYLTSGIGSPFRPLSASSLSKKKSGRGVVRSSSNSSLGSLVDVGGAKGGGGGEEHWRKRCADLELQLSSARADLAEATRAGEERKREMEEAVQKLKYRSRSKSVS